LVETKKRVIADRKVERVRRLLAADNSVTLFAHVTQCTMYVLHTARVSVIHARTGRVVTCLLMEYCTKGYF